MSNTIVFIADSASIVRALAPIFSDLFPTHCIYAITTNYVGLYEFRYPRGLALQDYPYISEPVWKPRRVEHSALWAITRGEEARVEGSIQDTLRAATTIYYACDPDPSGAIAFHTLLTQCLGEFPHQACPALRVEGLGRKELYALFDGRSTTDTRWFTQCLHAGAARRFFDYNFNTNALVLFGQALREVAGPSTTVTVSKYSLQLLYALAQGPLASEGDAVLSMAKWAGTGRYPVQPLGSAASRPQILQNLMRDQLISRNANGSVGLSALGEAFLDRLHPGCCDADLPARIRLWGTDWPASKPSMERYLRTFFGRQKRFAETRRRIGS